MIKGRKATDRWGSAYFRGMRIALNVIALVLLAFQILAYIGMDGKPAYMYYTPSGDGQSLAQWLGSFVGSNLFGLVGLVLLFIANTGSRRKRSPSVVTDDIAMNTTPVESEAEEEDDKDVVWEELKEWPKGVDEDGTK